MRTVLSGLLAFSLMVSAGMSPALAEGTISPGKKRAYVSAVNFALPVYAETLLTATIEKGKARTVLEITTMLSAVPGPLDLATFVHVNGVYAEPSGPGYSPFPTAQDCTAAGSIGCSITNVSFFDIDAAETAFPGMFVGQPLVVRLRGGAYSTGAGGPAAATMAVRVEKK